MNRIARHTKQPEVLRELFEALGNDPVVIAECLARPLLAERLITTRNDCNANVCKSDPSTANEYILPTK